MKSISWLTQTDIIALYFVAIGLFALAAGVFIRWVKLLIKKRK